MHLLPIWLAHNEVPSRGREATEGRKRTWVCSEATLLRFRRLIGPASQWHADGLPSLGGAAGKRWLGAAADIASASWLGFNGVGLSTLRPAVGRGGRARSCGNTGAVSSIKTLAASHPRR